MSWATGLRFRVLGFPVSVQPWFLLIAFALGPQQDGFGAVLVWAGVLFVSILAHELGHAVTARAYGHEAQISLYGMGGLTQHVGPPLSRTRNALVSVAGPATGISIGLVLLLAVQPATTSRGGLLDFGVRAAVFVNLWWGLANLLPVLPLDGGRILTEVLPGPESARLRVARIVSVVVGVGAGVFAWRIGYTYAAFIAGLLVFTNITALGSRAPTGPAAVPAADLDRLARSALALVDQGHPDKARHLLATTPGGHQVDPAVIALVLALTDGREPPPEIRTG